MLSKWRWLLMALAAVVVSCLVPGSMLSQVPSASGVASIEAPAPTATGGACAAVACNRGSTSAPTAMPSIVLTGALAAGVLVVVVARAARRASRTKIVLPAGVSLRLFRPPQLLPTL